MAAAESPCGDHNLPPAHRGSRRWPVRSSTFRGWHPHLHHHHLLLLLLLLLPILQQLHVSFCEAYGVADFLAALNDPNVTYMEVKADIVLTSSLPPLDRPLTVVGKGWKKNKPVLIDGATKYRGFVSSDDITLINLELRNFFTTEDGSVLSASGEEVVIERCAFRHNKANYGGAIAVDSTGYRIVRSQFIGNRATTFGGAMWSMSDSYGPIHDCLFERNSAESSGGALAFKSQIGVDIKRCSFRRNTAGEDGGAIWFSRGLDKVSDCNFDGNVAGTFGGAIRFVGDGQGVLTLCGGNTYSANKANPPTSNNLYIRSANIYSAYICPPLPPATLIEGNVTQSCEEC